MKIKRKIFTMVGITLVTLVVINFNSCDYFIKNKASEKARVTRINNGILTDKDEAKLLVMASQNNLDVIALCKIIRKEENVDEKVKNLLGEIKEEHIEILEKYNEVAMENVISIPNYSNLKENRNPVTDEALKRHLKMLNNKINNQIGLLEKLLDTTNNSEFKELVKYTNATLKDNLDKTAQTIKTLNTNS